ncbi:MAG: NAD(P)-binding domain-containing protein, partial [Bacillota bacterium]|nr:NAD(P)-binding domain-containing protein [Bacillota bacterium]
MDRYIAVIGAGGWGTALANLLSKKGYNVRVWVYLKEEKEELERNHENLHFLPGIKLEEGIEFSNDMEYCIKGALCVVSAVPSKAVEETAVKIAKYIDIKSQKLVTVSKGLDANTQERISQVICRVIPGVDVAVLSGPSHAEEVARGMITTNVAASASDETAEFAQEIFMTDYFRVYTNNDIIGVELGGALKNIIALCVGV